MKVAKIVNCSTKCKLVSLAALLGAVAGGVYIVIRTEAAQAAEPLGRVWPPSQYVSMEEIDHSPFDALLKKYVDSDGYVQYAAWKNSPSDRRKLQSYLLELSRASRAKQARRAGRLAFWINAYNAVTIEGILREYPTSSIRNHTSKIGYSIWDDLPLTVGGTAYSLNDIEHKILRKMGEPRIHFAIVCASVGCPRLRNEAYTAEKLEEQLTANARDFFSRRKNFRIDENAGTIYFSSILKWFGEDFGNSLNDRLRFLQPYLPPSAQRTIQAGRVRHVEYLAYDWSLNDQNRRPRTSSRR